MSTTGHWPYIFIAVAGYLATDLWRWLGVIIGNRLDDESEALIFVKAAATALVAAVIAKQIIYPGGVLASSPLPLRIGAAAFGFAVFLTFGRNMAAGIAAALATLAAGLYLIGF